MRKLLNVILILLVIAACPKSDKSIESRPGVVAPPDEAPTQMVVDPETGRDVTGEYVQLILEKYYKERDIIYKKAGRRVVDGEYPEKVRTEAVDELKELQARVDHALKHIPQFGHAEGVINLPELFERDQKNLEDIINSVSGNR